MEKLFLYSVVRRLCNSFRMCRMISFRENNVIGKKKYYDVIIFNYSKLEKNVVFSKNKTC